MPAKRIFIPTRVKIMHARLVPKYASLSFALVAIVSPLFHVQTNLCICKLFRIKSVDYIFGIVTSLSLSIFSRRQSVCTKIDAALGYDQSANAPSFLVFTFRREKQLFRCKRIIFICMYIVLLLAIVFCGTMVVS